MPSVISCKLNLQIYHTESGGCVFDSKALPPGGMSHLLTPPRVATTTVLSSRSLLLSSSSSSTSSTIISSSSDSSTTSSSSNRLCPILAGMYHVISALAEEVLADDGQGLKVMADR